MKVLNDILGYDLKLYQNQDWFCFSIDSVILANFARIKGRTKRILDIGCGYGFIGITIAKIKNAQVTMCDINKRALHLSEKNVIENNVTKKCQVLESNIYENITDKYDFFGISNFEFQDKVIYTYETIRHFKEEYPSDEIYFICGADNLSYIDKWEKGETILKNEKIIAIARNTDNLNEILAKYQKFSPTIEIATIDPIDLSSTEIRELIKKNNYKALQDYLNSEVLDYIIKNNLYKE